jgi:hypothetical protein
MKTYEIHKGKKSDVEKFGTFSDRDFVQSGEVSEAEKRLEESDVDAAEKSTAGQNQETCSIRFRLGRRGRRIIRWFWF